MKEKDDVKSEYKKFRKAWHSALEDRDVIREKAFRIAMQKYEDELTKIDGGAQMIFAWKMECLLDAYNEKFLK